MKKFIVLFLGLIAFTFMGVTPEANSNPTYSIEQNMDFEHSPVLTVVENQIETYKTDVVNSVSIFNIIGQTVLFDTNKGVLDISNLPLGIYLTKIEYSDKTTSLTKFIKADLYNNSLSFIDKRLLLTNSSFNRKKLLLSTYNKDKDKIKHIKYKYFTDTNFDRQINSLTVGVSNIEYTELLNFIKPFEKGWSRSYTTRT